MYITNFIACIVILLATTSSWAQEGKQLNDAFAQSQTPVIFDDAAFRRTQRSQTLMLEADGRLVTAESLAKQLELKTFQVSLPEPVTTASPMALKILYAKCRTSVFSIGEVRDCKGCGKVHVNNLGTGFAVTSDGVVLTNYHVIESIDASFRVVATAPDGKTYPVTKVLAANQNDDIAAVRIDGSNFHPLPLTNNNATGTRIAIVSHPRGNQFYLSEGIVTRHFMDHSIPSNPSRHLMGVSAEFAVGSSGAPVLDLMGNVVGMAATTTQLDGQMVLRDCVPSQRLLSLFSESTEDTANEKPDPLEFERKCLHATFAAIVQLIQKEKSMPPDAFNKKLQALHGCMVHAIKLCPNDPIATRYSEFLARLRKQNLLNENDK